MPGRIAQTLVCLSVANTQVRFFLSNHHLCDATGLSCHLHKLLRWEHIRKVAWGQVHTVSVWTQVCEVCHSYNHQPLSSFSGIMHRHNVNDDSLNKQIQADSHCLGKSSYIPALTVSYSTICVRLSVPVLCWHPWYPSLDFCTHTYKSYKWISFQRIDRYRCPEGVGSQP